MFRPFFISIPVILLSINACKEDAPLKTSSEQTDQIPVRVMKAVKSIQNNTISAGGQFTTDDETILAFKTGGIISSVYVNEGDRVKRGQLLASLNITEIAAQVNQAKIALEKASRDYKRAENLYRDSVATLEQFENAKTGLAIATEQVNAAQFNLTHSEIHALTDGYILRKFVNPGQLVGPGTPVLQTNGARNGNWLVRVGLSDRQWAQVSVGDSADISTDAFPNYPLKGIVIRKSEGVDPYTGSLGIDIKVISDPNVSLAAGMFGKITLHAAKQNELWSIPYSALLDGNAQSGFIFITRDGKTAERIPVKIALINGNSVLLSEGPTEDMQIIISGSAYLINGSAININK